MPPSPKPIPTVPLVSPERGALLPSDDYLSDKVCARTGFPDLSRVSSSIVSHACEVLDQVSQELGVEVVYSGFGRDCSVGKGRALPGSDLDDWIAVVRLSDTDRSSPSAWFSFRGRALEEKLIEREVAVALEFKSKIVERLDPPIVDRTHGPAVSSARDILRGLNGLQESPEYAMDTACDELLQHAAFGRVLCGDLSPLLQQCAAHSEEFHSRLRAIESWSYTRKDSFTSVLPPKLKHAARDSLVRSFPGLSRNAQNLICEICMRPCSHEVEVSWLSAYRDDAGFKELLNAGLLVTLDPASHEFRHAVEPIRHSVNWSTALYLETRTEPYFVPSFRPNFPDELLLTEIVHPGAYKVFEETLVSADLPDLVLPNHLSLIRQIAQSSELRTARDRFIAGVMRRSDTTAVGGSERG